MSLRRAAPGPQLATGRLRVDAGRAIAKLREYQLAERSAWVLEAIRAAVAAGATRIELTGDSNDIWLAWRGEPWPIDVLPALFDELVSPEAASDSYHVRLLAAAINSALGMQPAYVDVIAIDAGAAHRVRYTPEILLDPSGELGTPALRRMIVEAVASPEGRAPGMLVHLRRRFIDWRLLSEPPELPLAREACRDISVPIRVQGLELHRDRSGDVLRIPLGEGLDGFVAICEPERARETARLQVAERGVVLAEYPLELIDAGGGAGRRVPIRVFVDAPRMPTNASRSQVRRDAHPIAVAEERAHELVPALIAQLGAAVKQGAEPARAAALALVAAVASGPRWHADAPAVQAPLRELIHLPLVKNAVGEPRALAGSWRAEVHTGKQPFAAELAPWLEGVLWAPPDDPSLRLLGGADPDTRGTRRLARWARKQHRAQQRFFAHARREVRVLAAATPRIRASLGCAVDGSIVPGALFEDLTGEVCIYDTGDRGALVVLLDGRELERIELDSAFAFDVVIDSKAATPGDRYRGVKRDAEYKRVERAMRGGLVRALEAHALADLSDAADDDASRAARLFRAGLGLLVELGLPMRGPLASAPAYRTIDGRRVSLAELARQTAIGFSAPDTRVAAPAGRIVLELDTADRMVLAGLVRSPLVPYRHVAPADIDARAAKLAVQAGGALVVREPGLAAVIAPAWQGELRLSHVGHELEQRGYGARWLPCTIAIDSDALVPDPAWTALVDDAGLRSRKYAEWELALARAIARTLCGEQVPELVCREQVALDSKLGVALCKALEAHDPVQLLGEELVARLRVLPVVRVLGGEHTSMAELAERFTGAIPYLGEDSEPVAGFTPMIATAALAAGLCKLVGRQAENGATQLEQRRRDALRERRLAAHRARVQQPIAVPGEPAVAVDGRRGRGVVAVGDGPFEIRVFVDGRPFVVLHPSDRELPLVAAVEVAEAEIDGTFEAVKPAAARDLAIEVRATAPALLAAIAGQRPELLADDGPVRRLLARTAIASHSITRALLAAPAFRTVQGERVSLEHAAQPRGVISVAGWLGEWLGPGDEPAHACDAPVLYVPDPKHELARVIEKLHAGAVVDVTHEVSRLQARRRVARGLVPRPQVRGAPPALRRSLDQLGTIAAPLGHGEIALVEDLEASVLVHVEGSLRGTEPLDVLPAIELAVEEHVLDDVPGLAQQLAVELARDVLAKLDPATLSPRLQRNLVRAGLARRLPGAMLERVPRWRDFAAQHERFGDVWVVHEPTSLVPLDPERIAFAFDRDDTALARAHGWQVVDARNELELDQVARANLARPPATSLALPSRDCVLAEEVLAGDGVTSPRGVVAVLSPSAAQRRGVSPHRALHPFDRVVDPCKWPTLAIVDDARLAPDRTWQAPVTNDDWQAVAKEVRAASERALATIGEVPAHALVHLRITSQMYGDLKALRKAPRSLIRGVVWLTGTPTDAVAIRVVDTRGTRAFTAPDRLAIGGTLYVFAPDEIDLDLALRQLCQHVHGKLVRALRKQDGVAHDLVAAHVAHALALRTVRATDVRSVEFPCFSPRPLDARALSSLLRREDPVVVIRPGEAPNPDRDVVELVDDGSELARTLLADLGARIRRARPPAKPRPAPPPPPPAPAPVAPRPMKRAEPEPPHPLAELVKSLRRRLHELGIGGYDWQIVSREEPMFLYDRGIEISGNNSRLRALAAALDSRSAFANAGIDVVAAHLVTVLNVALSQITDASEAHALEVLLSRPFADRPRSRRSS